MRKLILLIVPLMLLSCKTKRETLTEYVYIERTDSLRYLSSRIDSLLKESAKRDSIHEKDSVVVMVKGDTVTIDRWHTVYKERSLYDNQKEKEIIHDTVFQLRTEYIDRYIDKEVTVEVNRQKWWQTALMWTGAVSVFLIAALLLWKRK